MRKHLIRWWYTPDWKQEQYRRDWPGHWGELFPDPFNDMWVHHAGILSDEEYTTALRKAYAQAVVDAVRKGFADFESLEMSK